MTVLFILLTAVLFIGAASAAGATQEDLNNITVNTSSVTLVKDLSTADLTFFNESNKIVTGDVYVSWDGGKTIAPSPLFYSAHSVNVTSPKYSTTGKYNVVLYNQSTAGGSISKAFVAITVVDATISKGGDAFVYQNIYIPDGAPNKLTKYSEGSNPSVVNQISGSNGVFYLTESVVNGQYGAYYYEGQPGSSVDTLIYVWYPELTLQAELTTGAFGATSGHSINGKTIDKNTPVTFLINSPKVAPALKPAYAKIVFTNPAGGKTTYFGDIDDSSNLGNITLLSTQTLNSPRGIGTSAAVAGTWTAQAEYLTAPFNNYAKKSNTISFTVQSTTLALSAAKDSVVRSNPFTVTIQGNSQMMYFIYLDGASAGDVNPTLQPGQFGMMTTVDKTATNFTSAYLNGSMDNPLVGTQGNLSNTWGYFETDASGQCVVQYNTVAETEDKTYTVKVYEIGKKYADLTTAAVEIPKGADYASVKVKVEKGAVTITASGDGSYFIGSEIKLTGTNTDSSKVFLFITGQNINKNGLILEELPIQSEAYNATNQFVSVKTDNTWEYKWDTSRIALDTGAYTIYATSTLTNGKSSTEIGSAVKLSDSEYATVSVNLKQPFLSAIPSGTTVARGDKIYIRGVAEGAPKTLNLFIFGPNFFEDYSITVESDGKYDKKIEIPSNMSCNQYFVVIQHPMYNGIFDAILHKSSEGPNFWTFKTNNATTGGDARAFVVKGKDKLQGSQAADALTKMIDSANIDDIYTKLTFTVVEPAIKIANVGDKAAGTNFTISGTTNLAVDDLILVDIAASSFSQTDKTSSSTNSGVSTTTKVIAGEGGSYNKWSIDVDSSTWKIDEYTVKACGIEVDITTTTNFNLVVDNVIATPTATATVGATTPTTTATTPTKTPTTPPTPGFGVFFSLAGLAAVALLVLRRN